MSPLSDADYAAAYRTACLLLRGSPAGARPVAHHAVDSAQDAAPDAAPDAHDAAHDAVRDAYLRVWHFRGALPAGERGRAWFYRVLVDGCARAAREPDPPATAPPGPTTQRPGAGSTAGPPEAGGGWRPPAVGSQSPAPPVPPPAFPALAVQTTGDDGEPVPPSRRGVGGPAAAESAGPDVARTAVPAGGAATAALDGLPTRLRTPAVLRFCAGLTEQEVAVAVRASRRAVRSWLAEANTRMAPAGATGAPGAAGVGAAAAAAAGGGTGAEPAAPAGRGTDE